MDYNLLNRHPRDRRIDFDAESHRYMVCEAEGGEGCEYVSVTTIVESLFEQFDADYWAARKATATVSALQERVEDI